jgi:hypothetical protein
MSTDLTPFGDNRPTLLRPIATPDEAINAHKDLANLINHTLIQGSDYGTIPGTTKPTLFKPGAERLCSSFGLRAEFEIVESEVNHSFAVESVQTKWVTIADPGKATKDKQKVEFPGRYRNKKLGESWVYQEAISETVTSLGLYRFVVRCRLFLYNGSEVGQGVGSCSTLESKYIRAPRDFENTVLKMAKKRAFLDATLTTIGLSDRFTMDAEDMLENSVSRGEENRVIDAEVVEEVPGSPSAPPQSQTPQAFVPGPVPSTQNPSVFGFQLAKEWQGPNSPLWAKPASDAQKGMLQGKNGIGGFMSEDLISKAIEQLLDAMGIEGSSRNSSAAASMMITWSKNAPQSAKDALKSSI